MPSLDQYDQMYPESLASKQMRLVNPAQGWKKRGYVGNMQTPYNRFGTPYHANDPALGRDYSSLSGLARNQRLAAQTPVPQTMPTLDRATQAFTATPPMPVTQPTLNRAMQAVNAPVAPAPSPVPATANIAAVAKWLNPNAPDNPDTYGSQAMPLSPASSTAGVVSNASRQAGLANANVAALPVQAKAEVPYEEQLRRIRVNMGIGGLNNARTPEEAQIYQTAKGRYSGTMRQREGAEQRLAGLAEAEKQSRDSIEAQKREIQGQVDVARAQGEGLARRTEAQNAWRKPVAEVQAQGGMAQAEAQAKAREQQSFDALMGKMFEGQSKEKIAAMKRETDQDKNKLEAEKNRKLTMAEYGAIVKKATLNDQRQRIIDSSKRFGSKLSDQELQAKLAPVDKEISEIDGKLHGDKTSDMSVGQTVKMKNTKTGKIHNVPVSEVEEMKRAGGMTLEG